MMACRCGNKEEITKKQKCQTNNFGRVSEYSKRKRGVSVTKEMT